MDNSSAKNMIVDLGYRAIIDALPCYLSIQDRSMRILFANNNFIRDFGSGIGKLCHEVYKGSPDRCEFCPVQKSFQDKEVHLGEETVRLSSGKMMQMGVYSAPILDPVGNVAAVMELATDITKIKDMQKELTFLGQSFAILSHDLKNILESLQGGAYVVDEGIKDRDMGLASKGWEIVQRNIVEISSLVLNILNSAKKRVPRYKKVSVERLLTDVYDLYRDKAREVGLSLKLRINPALPMIYVDSAGIRRMMGNLVSNAFEACREDSEKRSHNILIRADFWDRHHFMLEVEDDGVGMDDATVDNIFKQFYSTKGSNGTGLGLLVADKIAKEHDGRMEVLTAEGKGTTFRTILKL